MSIDLRKLVAIVALLACGMSAARRVDNATYDASTLGAEAMWQIPRNAKQILFVAHGCQHSATDFWAPTAQCPQCLGLPEEVRITKQALEEGFAVIAISSNDRDFSRCWNFDVDGPRVKVAIERFRAAHGLQDLPLVAFGASSGGAFVLQLAAIMPVAAVVSQIMAIPPSMLPSPMPPTLFVHMAKDQRTAALVDKCVHRLQTLKGSSDAAAQIAVSTHRPTATSSPAPNSNDDPPTRPRSDPHPGVGAASVGRLLPRAYRGARAVGRQGVARGAARGPAPRLGWLPRR